MPTLYRNIIFAITFISLNQITHTSETPTLIPPIITKLKKYKPAKLIRLTQEKTVECYYLQDLYRPVTPEEPLTKLAQLFALIKRGFQPKYKLKQDPNYPLLNCFSKKLSSEQILEDIKDLALFNKQLTPSTQKTFFSNSKPKASFFDPTLEFPMWKTLEDPRESPVEKITNQSIKHWYLIGDRHGDGISIDVLTNYLKGINQMSSDGRLTPEVGILLLGDYIDRGKDSIGTLHRIIQLKKKNPNTFFALRGNHEEGECGNGLQENLNIFGPNIMKELHHWYITAFCQLPQAFFLQVPNKKNQCPKFLNIVHGGIDSKQLEPNTYNNNIKTLQKFLLNQKAESTQLSYPKKTRTSPLWGDFSTTESNDSSKLGPDRKHMTGRKDVESYFDDLSIEQIIRAHQQNTIEKFSDTKRIPGIATYFFAPKNNPVSTTKASLNKKEPTQNIKNYRVITLNVASRTALATAPKYQGLYQLKYDTILRLDLNWKKGTWSEEAIHFDGKTGKVVPEIQLTF